jgi:hypothetical protein
MANYLDGLPGGKHNSDDTITSVTPKKKKQRFDVLSPDGISIHFSDTYPNEKAAMKAFELWKKRYEHQGYYSSNNGRIPLTELHNHIKIVMI